MRLLLRALDGFSRFLLILGAAALAILFLLGLAAILGRNLVGWASDWPQEMSGYLVALSLWLGAGEAMRRGRHIRVGLVAARLPAHLARTLDLSATAVGLAIATVLTFGLVRYGVASIIVGERSYFESATPLGWPQLLLSLGPLGLASALFARLVRLVLRMPVEG